MTETQARPEGWTTAVADRAARAASAAVASGPNATEPPFVRLATWIACLGLLATVAGRWLPRGLPGSAAGIGSLIAWATGVGALVSQLFALLGAALGLRLLSLTLAVSGLGVVRRLGSTVLGAGVLILVLGATQSRLDSDVAAVLAVLVIALALGVAPFMLGTGSTRAAGLGIGVIALAALARVASRMVAEHSAALPGLWRAAGGMASGAFVLDLAAMIGLGVWLAAPKPRRSLVIAATLALVAVALGIAAASGGNPGASAWQVVLLRSLEQSYGPPAPAVPIAVRLAVELFAVFVAAAALLLHQRPLSLRVVMSLAIMARASADVPALALCLTLASLLGLVSSPTDQKA